MASDALDRWRTDRRSSIDRLVGAHVIVGGSGPGRRWATEELNHALVLRLASEFQGFCKDLHDEAADIIAQTVAPKDLALQVTISEAMTVNRRLNSGNAHPDALRDDFSRFELALWPSLRQKFPTRSQDWERKLRLLNDARNGLAHDDERKLSRVRQRGWPATIASVRKWRSSLDGLTMAMDMVVGDRLAQLLKCPPW